jgi:hypothetical protein
MTACATVSTHWRIRSTPSSHNSIASSPSSSRTSLNRDLVARFAGSKDLVHRTLHKRTSVVVGVRGEEVEGFAERSRSIARMRASAVIESHVWFARRRSRSWRDLDEHPLHERVRRRLACFHIEKTSVSWMTVVARSWLWSGDRTKSASGVRGADESRQGSALPALSSNSSNVRHWPRFFAGCRGVPFLIRLVYSRAHGVRSFRH